ncbi:hypothetical protein [uncultured Salinicola sp.]|uniref:hypothetical protein n=1 Tax=uncultured Salinicola sp. TaxID=1193542 RepID=UPI00262E43DA|nr:hypothetical protein [uncultured Salinicola sp.]
MTEPQIINRFDQASLARLMQRIGRITTPVRVGKVDGVHHSVASRFETLDYSLGLDGETLKFVSFIHNIVVPMEFIVEWNNVEPVAPVIRLERDPPIPGFTHQLILKFDRNVKYGLPSMTFRGLVEIYEASLRRLQEAAWSETINPRD